MTATVTAPAAWAGVVAVMVVLFTTVTPVAAVPPNVTVAPAAKFVPVIVTAVPPAGGPLLVLTVVCVAAADPNVTVAPAAKFVPVIVTADPPAVVPLLGLTLVTVGATI